MNSKKQILIFFCILAFIPVILGINTIINDRKYDEYASIKTISAVIKSDIDIKYASQITNESVEFIMITYPHNIWTFHSGGPVAVFDSAGKLVDFTTDGGDDPDFQKKWYRFKEREINFKEYVLTTQSTEPDLPPSGRKFDR